MEDQSWVWVIWVHLCISFNPVVKKKKNIVFNSNVSAVKVFLIKTWVLTCFWKLKYVVMLSCQPTQGGSVRLTLSHCQHACMLQPQAHHHVLDGLLFTDSWTACLPVSLKSLCNCSHFLSSFVIRVMRVLKDRMVGGDCEWLRLFLHGLDLTSHPEEGRHHSGIPETQQSIYSYSCSSASRKRYFFPFHRHKLPINFF